MLPASLDHIGIAVKPGSRLAEALALLGLPVTGSEIVEREKVNTAWVPLPIQAAQVELLQATDPESAIQKYLDKNGRDGIHHLCFRVQDIRAVSERLVAAGFKLIYPEPKPGAHHCLVNFLHPQTTGGVLLEISERQKG